MFGRRSKVNKPKISAPLPGPKARQIIDRDKNVLSPSYTRSYPLVIHRGQGCWIEDVDSNWFLDFTAGIAVTATGHSHPQVIKSIQKQSQNFLHMSGTDFYYDQQVELAERLAKHLPGEGSKKVFFTNSGAEAIEAAMKLSRYHTKRTHWISFLGAFHGRTFGALSLGASKATQRNRFSPLVPGAYHVPYPDPRECPVEISLEEFAEKRLEFIEEKIFKKVLDPREVAGIFVESIQGEGGYIVPPKQFLKKLQALCRKYGILLIVDEIQSGIGRTGKFFAFEHFGIEPDVVTFAKGIASGLPLGGIITRSEIMDWSPGSHASTFGGNPVACAAALATLDLVEGELMANAEKQGQYLKEKLKKIVDGFTFVKEVRGMGLMLALEISDSVASKKDQKDSPLPLDQKLIQLCFEKGLLLLPCGVRSVRFCPALCVSRSEIDTALEVLNQALQELNKEEKL